MGYDVSNNSSVVELGQGGITRLFDKTLNKEVFNTSATVAGDLIHLGYNGNGAGEFLTMTAPNYNGVEFAHQKESSWSLLESGAVYSKFKSEYKMRGFSVEQLITVYHQEKQIDFCYQCNQFPCDRTNFDPGLYKGWVAINKIIQKKGIEKYHEEARVRSRYP